MPGRLRAPFFHLRGLPPALLLRAQVTIDELALCLGCAVEVVESQEPECECAQTDVDLFDPRGCEYHDSTSPWNVRLRAVTAAQQYEAAPKDAA